MYVRVALVSLGVGAWSWLYRPRKVPEYMPGSTLAGNIVPVRILMWALNGAYIPARFM